jgi:protein TonB
MQDWHDPRAAGDRLGFAVVMALVAHAALILGVGFTMPQHEPPPASIEVTLAKYRSDTADEDAAFLAQMNQQGSGDQDQDRELTTPLPSEYDASQAREVERAATAPAGLEQPRSAELLALRSETRQNSDEDSRAQQTAAARAPERAEEQAAADAASLIARFDELSRAYARRPRVHRLTSVSAKTAEDAAYLLAWTQRVEAVGNRNYPVEARRRRMQGDLRVLVALRADGTVAELRVLQSSGNRVLDDAALRIVRLSAPFDPLPGELRARGDVLEIIRTWQFRADRLATH